MKLPSVPLLWAALSVACLPICAAAETGAPEPARPMPAPPMVDGDCGEYAALGAERHVVDADVTLSIHQDPHYIWVCYTLPEDSFGMLDMRVESDALARPLNLHVSAQLGEWPADDPDAAPSGASSDAWWRIHGWTANWQWFHGLDTSGASPRPAFVYARAREVQLARSRFGSGPVRLVLKIESIRRADGSDSALRVPESGVLTVPGVPAAG